MSYIDYDKIEEESILDLADQGCDYRIFFAHKHCGLPGIFVFIPDFAIQADLSGKNFLSICESLGRFSGKTDKSSAIFCGIDCLHAAAFELERAYNDGVIKKSYLVSWLFESVQGAEIVAEYLEKEEKDGLARHGL